MTSAASQPERERGTGVSVVPLVPVWRVDHRFDYALPPKLQPLVKVGSLVRVPFGNRRVRAVVASLQPTATEGLEEVVALVAGAPVAPGRLIEVFDWLARRYAAPQGRAFERAVPPRVRLKVASPQALDTASAGQPRRLTTYAGGEDLLRALQGGSASNWSVRTLSGEDHGALIVEMIESALNEGGQALVAVPEVRWGSATLGRLSERWPQTARVDSAQPPGERSSAWLRIGAGAPLGAGGRSTVLAPAEQLRLIVVDDEHHVSYKEDRSPRYDARRVALERARVQGASCVFVSPTPSLEVAAPARDGIYGEVAPGRADERSSRPIVETVAPSTDRVFSHELHERIRDTLKNGERIALLVPARGYARALWCATCRRSVRCPACESGLFYDRLAETVRCVHCGFRAPAPSACPNCGSREFRYVGAGSERLSEQLRKSFPRATVGRMDPDVIGDVDKHPRDVDIYVTTWIGTKQALRPSVRLVGVLDADSLLRRPDFRAAENTYQALAEMSAWAGPASQGGRLVIQTAEPGHHAIQAVVRADYGFWVDSELEERRELSYPPFAELVRATTYGPRKQGLIERAAGLAREIGAVVLGPVEVKSVVGAGQLEEGLEILVKAADAEPVARALRGILASVPTGSRLRVDVDPR
jgi:primosomal protein N' (replication factor Y) (superfamily II helicase)